MIKKLVFFDLATLKLVEQIIPNFNDLIVVVNMTSYKIVKICFESTDDLSTHDSKIDKRRLCLNIVNCDKLVSLFLSIFDAGKNY